ncbi:MAG: hydroxypyruvate isomerase family protein, partial [Verrucomicrobiales bacterium]
MNRSRRKFFKGAAGVAAGAGIPASAMAQLPKNQASTEYTVAQDSPIRHSVMGWCFKPMRAPELAKHCVEIGLKGIEGIGAGDYPAVRDLGLEISLVSGGHGFANGPCNPANTERVVAGLTSGIDLASEIGTKNVITFTGMKYDGMDPDKAAQLCVDTWKRVLPLAEEKGVTLVLEHLNSRDDTHPMKGHPGYFGDDVEFCIDLIKRVGSPNLKLLFDVYHVSVMNGDVIRRIRQYKDLIGHYHTAGNPGRGELDENQEINYPAVMREIVKTGYDGFVAHEFIPTWDDKVAALRHGVQV